MSPIFSRHPRGELSAYVDAQVTDSKRQAIETHLASCESCRLEAEDLRAVRSSLAALPEVAAPRSFAITAEMVAAPAAAPAAERAPSFGSGLRMASAAIGVALIAVVLVDAGNFSATDSDDDSSGGAERGLIETQGDETFSAIQGTDSASVAEPEADQPSELDAATDQGTAAGSAGGAGGGGPLPDAPESENGGNDSAEGAIAAAPVPTEPPSDGSSEDSLRSADANKEPYGLFPGVPAPPDYVYSAPKTVNGGIGGFAPSSGMGNTAAEPETEATEEEAEAAPEATAAEAPAAEDTAGEDALSEGAEYAVEDEDDAVAPDAAGDGTLDAAVEDDSGGLSTLNIIEIVLAIGLVAAIVGGFVLPRLRRTA